MVMAKVGTRVKDGRNSDKSERVTEKENGAVLWDQGHRRAL
jgi:hypothetical protein